MRDTPLKITRRVRRAAYGLGVGTTGVIFAAIAIAWLAYLVPHFVRRRDDEDQVRRGDPADRFADSIRIVRHGTAPLLDQDLDRDRTYEVSTPLTRRAAIADLRRLERLAAPRRRRVLLALMAVDQRGRRRLRRRPDPVVVRRPSPAGWSCSSSSVARGSACDRMRRSLDARYRDDPPGQRRGDGVPEPQEVGQPGRRASPAEESAEETQARGSVGSRADHHADLRVQAAGPANRAHHRPLRSRRRLLGPVQHPVTADAPPAGPTTADEVSDDESGNSAASGSLRLRW